MTEQKLTDVIEQADQRALDLARALVEAYPVAIDANDVDGVVSLFEDGAILETPTARHEGREAIGRFFGSRLVNDTLHLVTDTRLDLSGGGQVESRSRFCALVGHAERPELTWGNYVDRITIRDGQARFQVRSISIDGAGSPPDVWAEVVKGYRQARA
jgi:ketosteroid isomerase-like protein